MTKGRLEAFSDGVLAIAITLLTLTLPLPLPSSPDVQAHGLAWALGNDWPQLVAYVVSFAIIGIIWVNHHGLMNRVAVVDRTLLFLNLLLLLFVAAIPWATNLFAEYMLEGGASSHVAAAVFSTNALCMGLSFYGMWLWILRDASRLHESIDPEVAKSQTRRFGFGNIVYVLTIGVSFISAPLTLAFHGVVAAYYVFDQLPRGHDSAVVETEPEAD